MLISGMYRPLKPAGLIIFDLNSANSRTDASIMSVSTSTSPRFNHSVFDFSFIFNMWPVIISVKRKNG
jgi:hypothetical protein